MNQAIPRQVQLEAAEWLVELQTDDLDDDARRQLQQRLQHWRAAAPEHERAWQCVQALGERLQPLSGTPASQALAQAARATHGGRRRAVKHLAALLFVGGASGAAAWRLGSDTSRDWLAGLSADVRTGTAERRGLSLPDGTQLQLNADSAIDIAYGDGARAIRLRSGDLHVATAHQGPLAALPFVVDTRHGRIRALGTRFTVRQRGTGHTEVAVFEGATAITLHSASAVALTVQAGMQSRFDATGATPARPADPLQSAWTRGVLVAQDMPLADFVAELARYRPGHLGCDPALAHLRVSGTYPLDGPADTDHALAMLPATLPVRLRHLTRYWVMVEPRP